MSARYYRLYKIQNNSFKVFAYFNINEKSMTHTLLLHLLHLV